MAFRPALLTTVAVAAAALLLAGCSGTGDAVAGQNYRSGDGTVRWLAPSSRHGPVELHGKTLTGQRFDLRSLRGRVTVVNVWASWCPPCIAEAPALQQVHEQTQAEGVAFVGIDNESDVAAATAHERRFGVTYPSIGSDGGRVLLSLRGTLSPKATPSTLVLDRQGRVAARVLGRVSADTLSGLIDDVRTGRETSS
ncbi:MAG TPA: TlpA disulfide reductase family protein [Actinomycetes bacterium]|jgi:thiol-disulfide isomerase/thioredoxin|nr:TlpA disulfide reductase family protein [Actinomycetes bacterium]